MKIIQITPAGRKSKSGNRTTADRWTRLLRDLGHDVETLTEYQGQSADMMVAIHAWRSADAIYDFKKKFSNRPIVLCLGGTDINQFIHTHPETTLSSMELADALVGLHERIGDIIPRRFKSKLHVILQSARPLRRSRDPSTRYFEVCVIGNLRDVKDPMRAAIAVRKIPESSKLYVRHFGSAFDEQARNIAQIEMKANPRYRWFGEVPAWRIRQELSRAHAMVISSRAEGGANVVSEAIVANVPVIASDIDGNIGLLGREYSGYYRREDEASLRDVLLRVENNPDFLEQLTKQVKTLAPKFSYQKESERWGNLIAELS